jgi:transposase
MTSIKNRKNYKSEFKAKVAMEAVAGRRTINEIAKEYQVHPNQISQWKKQFLEAVPQVFENRKARVGETGEELTNQLYEQIGRLKVELDWLKKKSAMFG